mmetsp:Transcript_69685/g.167260  ORF Transcript_69685/g.167260 Transcript_69685/m.167260 type:complete len:229 (+) Transcript_69685:693-1379(+)
MVADSLLHRWRPLAEVVPVRPLASPFTSAPWVETANEEIPFSLRDPQDSVCMTCNKPIRKHTLATLARSFHLLPSLLLEASGEQPTSVTGLLQKLEVAIWVLPVHSLDVEVPTHAPKEGGDRFGRSAPITHLVAGMELAESLLKKGNPHLLWISAARVEELTPLIHWEPIVYDDMYPISIVVETNAINANIHVIRNEEVLDGFAVVPSYGSNGTEQEASANRSLDNVS